MKNINLLSPENSSEGEISDEQKEIFYETKTTSGKNFFEHKILRYFGLIVLLFLVFLLAHIVYQKIFLEKPQVPVALQPPFVAPKKHKQVEPKKLEPVKQITTQTQAPKDILTPLPAKKVKTAISKPTTPVEEREYFLLMGILASQKQVLAELKNLKALGFKPYQQRIRVKQQFYMVYVGHVTDYESARKLQKRLRKQGFDTYLPSENDKKYRVRTGVFANKNYAQTLSRKLQAKGYKATIQTKQMSLNKYEVRLGDFKTYQAAKTQQNALQTKGVKGILLIKQ